MPTNRELVDAHVRAAAAIVATWPPWKRGILEYSGRSHRRTPRPAMPTPLLPQIPWLDGKPTVPGLYYWQEGPSARVIVCEIERWPRGLFCRPMKSNRSQLWYEVRDMPGRFAGPLPEPE